MNVKTFRNTVSVKKLRTRAASDKKKAGKVAEILCFLLPGRKNAQATSPRQDTGMITKIFMYKVELPLLEQNLGVVEGSVERNPKGCQESDR